MTNPLKILACVDATPIANTVADYAAWVARRLNAPLEILHVLDRHGESPTVQDLSGAIGLDAQDKLLIQLSDDDEVRTRAAREAGRIFLNQLRERSLATGVVIVDSRLRHGKVEETLAEQQHSAQWLVMGRANAATSAAGTRLGQHLEWVVRAVNRPILVAAAAYTAPSLALFAFDGSAVARRGVEMLSSSVLLKNVPLHLVMTGAVNAQKQRLLDGAVQTLNNAGYTTTSALLPGKPHDVVAALLKTQPFDLLVMGAYSHSPLRSLLLGSETTALLKSTQVATLLLR